MATDQDCSSANQIQILNTPEPVVHNIAPRDVQVGCPTGNRSRMSNDAA